MANESADILASAGVDLTQFEAGIDQLAKKTETLTNSAKKTDAAVKGVGASATKSGRGLQNFSFQIADVAVQAEMGTSALRILGQQGSQALAAFGVGGAIAGGVLALGAAAASWALNTEEATKRAEAFAKEIEDSKKHAVDLAKELKDIRFGNLSSVNTRTLGKDEADRLERENKYLEEQRQLLGEISKTYDARAKSERELAAIEDKRKTVERAGLGRLEGGLSKLGFGDAEKESKARDSVNARVLEEQRLREKLVALQSEYLIKEQEIRESVNETYHENIKIENALNRQLGLVNRETETETEKIERLREEARELQFLAGITQKTEDEKIKLRIKALKLLEEAKGMEEDMAKRAEAYAKKRVSDGAKFGEQIAKSAEAAAKKVIEDDEKRKKAAHAAEVKRIKERAEIEKKAKEKAGDEFDSRVNEAMMTPAQRAANRREQRRRQRAERHVNTQDRIRAQNRARGARNQHSTGDAADSAEGKARAAFVARNAPTILAGMIQAESLTVTTLKPK